MINDSEHREIAARLRESREFISSLPKTTPEKNVFDTFELILACIGYEAGNLFDYLADLIDRPTCRNIGGVGGTNGEYYDFFCSVCGFASGVTDPKYCPNCGAEVEGVEE